MKKLLIVAACLGMQSAYATKARMSALGQDTARGSFTLRTIEIFGDRRVLLMSLIKWLQSSTGPTI